MLIQCFAQPEYLLTMLALPFAVALILYSFLRRRHSLAQLRSSVNSRKGIVVNTRLQRWKTLCFLTALTLLCIACAGPQWGLDPTPQQQGGRDVILILDLSRSMLAQQPSRRELALRSLKDLADAFEQHGGNRVALVIFAARAKLLFPLTQDYDHLRHSLKQIEADDYPALSDEEIASGTRIGAALKLAVAQCDPEQGRRPLLVLLSDGDDPAGDDEEWLGGVMEAKKKQLRIHTVGIGDPLQSHTIPVGKERLEYEGKPVRTMLDEPRLRDIAERTGGVYLPAHAQALPLGTFVQYLLDADALRVEEPIETALPVYQQRYAWFLLPAVLLLMLTMFLNEGPIAARRWPWRYAMKRPTPSLAPSQALALALMAAMLVSAEPAQLVDSLLHQGNDAFERQDYAAALQFYEDAEAMTFDPGLIAFNKGAAYYRLKKYREAIDCYRRCLEDDAASPSRRARASFDLGNALLQEAGENPDLLAQAATAYRACLVHADLPAALRQDARHNLELAQMLWLRALAQKQQDPAKKDNETPEAGKKSEDKTTLKEGPDPKGDDGSMTPVDPKNGSKPAGISAKPGLKPSDKLQPGTPQTLPDQDDVISLKHDDASATLEKIAQRIAEQRRQQRHRLGPPAITTKDW